MLFTEVLGGFGNFHVVGKVTQGFVKFGLQQQGRVERRHRLAQCGVMAMRTVSQWMVLSGLQLLKLESTIDAAVLN